MMGECPKESEIKEYAWGVTLSVTKYEEIERHLSQCEECCRIVASVEEEKKE